MLKTSYQVEERKEKHERSDIFEEPSNAQHKTASDASKTVNLQELNSRFVRYINRARVLEQRNAMFRKQESAWLEEAFIEQISASRQRIRELLSERTKLERELKDAERVFNDFNTRYRNECHYQEQLHRSLEQLNKEADMALLRNLEYQIESQYLQENINSTRDRHMKNLADIRTCVNILNQINQNVVLMPSTSVEVLEEHERLIAQRQVASLQVQLEERKSALCRLQAQKQRLGTETSLLEQTIKNLQENYDDEIQLYNEQIETLRKEIEADECLMEKCTIESRSLAMYQTSLENEPERYKRIFENEDSRLNSAIIGTPISLFATNYRYTQSPTATTSRGKDITQAVQDIVNIKPHEKNLTKKVSRKKELNPKDMTDSGQDEQGAGECVQEEEEAEVKWEEHPPCRGVGGEDVPDGALISKALNTLCNIIRERIQRYKRPEPIANYYTQGHYILVTGESSYEDPCFCTSTPSAGHVNVTLCHDVFPPHEPQEHQSPSPSPNPSASSGPGPIPLTPPTPSKTNESRGKEDGDNGKGRNHKGGNADQRGAEDPGTAPVPEPDPSQHPQPTPPDSSQHTEQHSDRSTEGDRWQWRFPPMPLPHSSIPPDSTSYEKVEVIETMGKLSPDKKVKGYKETAMVVETMIEKTRKKKQQGNWDT